MTASDPKSSPKRDAIMAAALALFAERGFHGASVPEVASQAQVGAGTIYRYFESKEALVNALYQAHKAAVGEAVLKDFPFDKSAREQFHAFWTRAIAFARKHPQVVRFLELHHHANYLDGESKKCSAQMEVLATGLFEKTARLGVTKKVPSALIMALVWGGFTGVMKAFWEGRLKLTEDIIADSEQCIWEAIRL